MRVVRTVLGAGIHSVYRGVVLGTALTLAVVAPAFAHEHGVITLSAKSIAAHNALVIHAEKMSKNASFRLELRGALNTYVFGRVRSDTGGRFDLTTNLPAEAGPGSYAVVAVASDGDVSARAELTVTDGSMSSPGSMPGMAAMPGMANMPHATAEYMSIPSTTTTAGWIVIVAAIGASALIGALLLRPPTSRVQ